MFLHAMQLAISINLGSVFYLWYIVFLSITAVNNYIMKAEISEMHWLPNMQQLTLLTLSSHPFSGCSRGHVTVVFASKGCQYLINECLQPMEKKITQDSKMKIVDALLALIPRMRQRACPCSFSQSRLALSDKWISATNRNMNYLRCEAENRWRCFSGCGRENVAVILPSQGCQYLTNESLQPIRTYITQDEMLKIIDALLTLILRMQQEACCCSFSQ